MSEEAFLVNAKSILPKGEEQRLEKLADDGLSVEVGEANREEFAAEVIVVL